MKIRKPCIVGMVAVVMLCMMICSTYANAQEVSKDTSPIDTREDRKTGTAENGVMDKQAVYDMSVESNGWEDWPEGPQMYGEAAILMEANSGAILYAKNIDGKAYPASITKILTMLIALENANLDDKITITKDSVNCLEYGYSNVGLKVGEEISLGDTLHATMLASANEAAYAVADNVGESYEWFIQEMNSRCKELGAVHSNFNNANGMEDPNHYTTARDMALITRELLLNHPEFKEISQTLQYTIEPTNLEAEARTFQQKHKMFCKGNQYYNGNVIAGKTGYTDIAKNTLVTCASNEDITLICVVLKVHGKNVYEDTQKLLDYGFENFKAVDLKGRETLKQMKLEENDAYVVLPEEVVFEDVQVEIVPDEKDKRKGTAIYTYEGQPVGEADIRLNEINITGDSSKNIANYEKNILNWMKYIAIGLIILTLLMFLYVVYYMACSIKNRKKRRRYKKGSYKSKGNNRRIP